jgi:hypothetical protein
MIKERKESHSAFHSSYEKFVSIIDQLQFKKIRLLNHRQLEDHLKIEGRELLRRLFQDQIDSLGIGDIGRTVIGTDNIIRSDKRIRNRQLITIFGKVNIKRMGYGFLKKESLFPKDALLNLPTDLYSHGMRKLVAIESSKNSFSETIQAIEQITGVEISKREAEKLSLKASDHFNLYYLQKGKKEQVESQDLPLVILTVDGKGIVMKKEDLKEATRKKSEQKASHKLNKRRSKGEKSNRKRMATVASVYNIDRFFRKPEDIIDELFSIKVIDKKVRPKAVNKRVWASIEREQAEVINDIFLEGLRRDPEKKKRWVCLVDGDPRQIKRIISMSKKYNIKVTIVVDIIHVIEYIWKAGRDFYKETDPEVEEWVTERLVRILHGNAPGVAAGIRRSATLKKLKKETRKSIDLCANYLLNKSPYLKYNYYLKEGFPIATGVIEGACRYLIKDRMDVTGARWTLKGAEAVIKLRSLRSSGDFEEYWQFHEEQEYFKNYLSKYHDPSVIKTACKLL